MNKSDLRLQHQDSKPLLISFSGVDGSGKSTQIKKLCEQFSAAGLPVTQMAFWDHVVAFPGMRADFSHKFLKSDGGVGARGKPVQRNDKNARTWYLSVGRSALYLLDALHLRQIVAQARSRNSGIIVFDRYIYDQLATLPLERAWARAYARLLLKIVPKPDVAYLLDAEPEAARERKPEYPLTFLHRYRRSYLQLRDIAGLALIDPMPEDEVQSAIVKKLERCYSFSGPPPEYTSPESA